MKKLISELFFFVPVILIVTAGFYQISIEHMKIWSIVIQLLISIIINLFMLITAQFMVKFYSGKALFTTKKFVFLFLETILLVATQIFILIVFMHVPF